MTQWFYVENGKQNGPVSEDQMKAMLSAGQLPPESLVWSAGMKDWQPASSTPTLQVAEPETPTVTASVGQSAATEETPVFIRNYLPWAIAATVLCCVPAGIVSIIYSAKASNAQAAGLYAQAQDSAGKAKMWLIISIVLGALACPIGFMMGLFQGAIENGM